MSRRRPGHQCAFSSSAARCRAAQAQLGHDWADLGHLAAGGVSVNGEPGTLEGMPGKPRKAGARELVNDLQFKGGLKGPSRIN